MLFHSSGAISGSLSKEILFLQNNETFYLTFFSVKKEAKKLFSYFLWRRERSKETSTPYQTTPYMGCLNRRIAEAVDSSTLLVSRDTRWSVYRLAHEEKPLYHC